MATEAQLAANRANAQHSTGPRTAEGKARVSGNATVHGLFSVSLTIHPEEAEDYEQLRAGLFEELAPSGILEHGHVMEIVAAFWRLHRCNQSESTRTEESGASLDRARAQASNSLRRAIAELRRLQTERDLEPDLGAAAGLSSRKERVATLASDTRRLLHLRKLEGLDSLAALLKAAEKLLPGPRFQNSGEITNQSQTPPRNSLCPCGSGQKFKRCCIGRSQGHAAPAAFP